MPTVNFYVDGFNLYYGSLKNRWPQFKWLNLQTFCEGLAAGRTVKRVRYLRHRPKTRPATLVSPPDSKSICALWQPCPRSTSTMACSL